LTILPSSYADSHEIWGPQSPGTLHACAGIALSSADIVQHLGAVVATSIVWTSIESTNRTMKKVAKIILNIWVQNVPSPVKVGSTYFLLRNPRVNDDFVDVADFSAT
jgi:hypothetical protein